MTDINKSKPDEAIAALRSEQWIPVGERLPTHIYSVLVWVEDDGFEPFVDCGIYNANKSHWQINDGEEDRIANVTHWMPLPAAPSRETDQRSGSESWSVMSSPDSQESPALGVSLPDHPTAEPALSAEQRVIALLEENRKASCERPTGEAMYSNTARRYLIEDRHKAVETLCLQIAKEADATALRSLTARDEGIEAAAKAAHESLRDIDRAHAEIAYSAASALKGQP